MTPAASDTPLSREPMFDPNARIRLVLDDATADRLRDAADRLGMTLVELMSALLRAASFDVDDVLDRVRDIESDAGMQERE
jgi:hypothetical protein